MARTGSGDCAKTQRNIAAKAARPTRRIPATALLPGDNLFIIIALRNTSKCTGVVRSRPVREPGIAGGLSLITSETAMDQPEPKSVTQMLKAWGAGEPEALEKLVPAVYRELRRMAKRRMAM